MAPPVDVPESPIAPGAAPPVSAPESLTTPGIVPPVGAPEPPATPPTPPPVPLKEQPAPASPSTERAHEIPPVSAGVGETEVLRAFLAGLNAGELPADRQAQAQLTRTTGQLLRAMTEGLMRVLMGRTSFKNELRLEVTTIRAAENNPFKFSIDPGDALAHLLFRPNRGFLPPWRRPGRPSTTSSAMRWQSSPGCARRSMRCWHAWTRRNLEGRFRDRSVLDNLMPMARKAKYWDPFTKTYQEIAADAADDFLNLFRDAFTRAYEEQAARLRQVRPPD